MKKSLNFFNKMKSSLIKGGFLGLAGILLAAGVSVANVSAECAEDCMSNGYFGSASLGWGMSAVTKVDWTTNSTVNKAATPIVWKDATGTGELKRSHSFLGQVALGKTFDETTSVKVSGIFMPETDMDRKSDKKLQQKARFYGGDVGLRFAMPMGWISPHIDAGVGIGSYRVDLTGNSIPAVGSDFNPDPAKIEGVTPNEGAYNPVPYRILTADESKNTGYYKAGVGFDFNFSGSNSMLLGIDYQFIAAFKRADFTGTVPTGGTTPKYEPLFAYNNILGTITIYPGAM